MMGIFLVASVSASDLNESMSLESDTSLDEGTVALEENENNQSVSSFDEGALSVADDEVIATNYNPRTAGEIQSCVDSANSGDTIVLDGYYLINSTISVGKQLNFIGKNNAVIDGNKNVQLFSVSGNNVIFKDITFKNGNSDYGGAISSYSTAINCTFTGNVAKKGGAIAWVSAVNCTFANNSATDFHAGAMYYGDAVNCTFVNNSAAVGGAVYYADVVNCTFINNYAGDSGGAWSGSSSYNLRKIISCIFIGNSAKRYGGAICYGVDIRYGGAVNCTFINNTVNQYGGSAIAFGSASNSIFINNSAGNSYYDGTVYGGDAVNCSFINNYGSAMSSSGSYQKCNAINCTFINNTNSGSGGALYKISAVNCTFTGNSANQGGAMSGGSAVNCTFIGNSASRGGALHSVENVVNCTFVNNSAGEYGGAAASSNVRDSTFVNNSAANGGAMSGGYAVNCSFVGNSANECGGAISDCNNVFNCSFDSNSASNGGASYNSDLVDCTLANNHADDAGGASYNSNVLNCAFENNYAKNGGAISGKDYNATDCSFTNNSAENGGAAYQSLVINCRFSKNNATLNGGSVYEGFASNCTFINNYAGCDGGAAYGGVVANSIFEYNHADNDGGAVNSLKATRCTFNNNQAGNCGGAVCNSQYSSDSNFNNNVADVGNDEYNSTSFEMINTLADLNSLINDNNLSDIYLSENYVFDYSLDYNFREGIIINRPVTIHGNNVRIDGNNLSRIFYVTDDSVVFKDIHFANCNSSTYGGVINGVCTAINCTFMDNVAKWGGAMYGGSAVNCSFIGNHANSDGGAMYYGGSAVNCTFKNNVASRGGALSDINAVNCTFINNSAASGGAIAWGSAVNCTFINNSATGDGGAAYGYAFNIKFSLENCTFINNSAGEDGGAIAYDYDVFNSSFINNSASEYGGAMCSCSAVKCIFTENSCYDGGAVYGGGATDCIFINNSATKYGSCLSKSTAVNCTFINNSASQNGVAYSSSVENCTFSNHDNYPIYSSNAKNCLFVNNSGAMNGGSAVNCTFINNSASKGGAIYAGSSAVNCIFINNSADDGGAIYYKCDAVNCTFINNSASQGGAMNYAGSAVNCTFINNHASDSGGATYEVVNVLNCTFINNTATNNAGAVKGSYYGGGPPGLYLAVVENCTFIDNAAEYGGAITDTDRVVNCTFINNSATFGGSLCGTYDVYYYYYSGYSGHTSKYIGTFYTKVYNCTFINGSAAYGGAMYDGNASNCSFINNSADYGGAIYLENNMAIIDCDFTDCHANRLGGAIYWNQSANITSCTFKNCTSGEDSSCLAVNSSQGNYTVFQCIFDEYPTNIEYHYVSSLSANNLTYFNGEEGLVIASLCDIRGAIAGRIVTIAIGGKKYNATTDSDGLARFNIDAYLNKEGIYNATVCFEGDSILYSDSVNITIEINRHIAILKADDLILYKNEYGTLVANLSNIRGPLSGKRIIFSINTVSRTITTDENGVAEFNVLNYVASKGEYVVNITFAGDDFNHPVSTNVSFVYIDYEGVLTGSVDGKYFNDTILSFNLINNRTSKPVSNAPIRLTFSNGVIVNLTTDVDGNVEYRIPFVPDYYDVTARVVGEYVNVDDVVINEIEISKIFGVIEHSVLNGNKTLRFKLSSRYGSDVFRNVRIDLLFSNGVAADIVTDGNGIASYDIPFPKGVYSVSVSVKGDYKDFEDDYIGNIVVTNDLNSSINFTNDIVFDFGEYGSTNFTVDGGTLNRDNISVLNHSEAIISLSGNTITVFGLSVGKYVLMVETTPDDYHNPVTAMLNITVNNVKSKVNLKTGVVFAYGGSASIHVTVDGGIVEQKNIRILNHPEAAIGLSGSVITISGLNVGNYILSVTSTPDSDHTVATSNVTVTVNKATAVITAQKVTVALKKGSLWSITLVDSTNKRPIANMKLTLKVYTGKKFKTVTVTTNSKGVATYQTRGLSKGTHKIVISAFDANYDFNTMTSSIKVIKQKALKFKVKKKIAKDGSSLSITVKYKNKPINGVKLKVKVYNGKKLVKTVTLKTKTKGKYKGVAGWGTNKLKVGNHKIVIEPASIQYGGSKSLKMKIKKSAKRYPKWETKI